MRQFGLSLMEEHLKERKENIRTQKSLHQKLQQILEKLNQNCQQGSPHLKQDVHCVQDSKTERPNTDVKCNVRTYLLRTLLFHLRQL